MSVGGAALAILPLLVSGFLFCLIFHPTRFLTAKFDGQRLFFLVAAFGMTFVGLGALLHRGLRDRALAAWPWLEPVSAAARDALPVSSPGAAVAGVALSILAANLLNLAGSWIVAEGSLWARWRNGWSWTVRTLTPKVGDPLQQALVRAVALQKKVQVCLDSGRVYIGLVYRFPSRPHVETAYIELLTSYSLMREEVTGKFPPRSSWTRYPGVVLTELRGEVETRRLLQEGVRTDPTLKAHSKRALRDAFDRDIAVLNGEIGRLERKLNALPPEDWVRVIPVAQIETIAFFEDEVFDAFKGARGEAPRTAPAGS